MATRTRRTSSPVVKHIQYQASFHQAFTSKLGVFFIYSETTPGPPKSQNSFMPFEAIHSVIHLKITILSLELSILQVIFLISSIIYSISTILIEAWYSGPYKNLLMVWGGISTWTPGIITEVVGSPTFYNWPCGYWLCISPFYMLHKTHKQGLHCIFWVLSTSTQTCIV